MPQRWISQLIILAIWLASSLLLGIWFGSPLIWLLAAVTLYLASHLRHLYILDQALQSGEPIQIYETRGLWPEIYARINGQRRKLRNRKKKYHRLLREVRQSTDALSDAGIILNSESEIQWFNPATKRLLGFDAARDMNQRIDNLIRHPDFVRYLENPSGDAVTIPSPINDADQLSVQIIPYGKKQRMAIIRDITHQLQLERMRRDFVANASHELRSPLTVISGYLDGLEDEKDLPTAWVAPMGEMQRQVERMTRILQDLIELTRMESAGREADREFVNVADLLGNIQQEFQTRKEIPEITFDVSTEVGLLGDESELHSIFYNLISNAVRFTSADGEVAVAWTATPAGAVFTVTDTGIGIPDEQIPRITERFFRVDPGRSREMGGTGLGLAIVKHALQRHDGTLTIDSRLGEGSKFSCDFPGNRVVLRHDSAHAAI